MDDKSGLMSEQENPANLPRPGAAEKLAACLEGLGISIRTVSHAPVFTVEEARAVRPLVPGDGHSKNLFLRDKKKQSWLVVTHEDCPVDLSGLGRMLNGARLSFASPQRLYESLGVRPGSVSPFALVNDDSRSVRLVLDKQLLGCDPLFFHPLRNDLTSAISPRDFLAFVHGLGYEPLIIDPRQIVAADKGQTG